MRELGSIRLGRFELTACLNVTVNRDGAKLYVFYPIFTWRSKMDYYTDEELEANAEGCQTRQEAGFTEMEDGGYWGPTGAYSWNGKPYYSSFTAEDMRKMGYLIDG